MKTLDYQNVGKEQTRKLRESGLLMSDEVAFLSGDLLVAENVVTKSRRVLGDSDLLNESKRLLKG